MPKPSVNYVRIVPAVLYLDLFGRANEKEFVGFFTSAYYTGTFNLARAKARESK
jgi:hypothetical protein